MYVNIIVLCLVSLACLLVAQSCMGYGTGTCICSVLCRKMGLSWPIWVYRGPDGSIVAQMGLSLPGWVYRGPDGSVVARYLRKWCIIDTVWLPHSERDLCELWMILCEDYQKLSSVGRNFLLVQCAPDGPVDKCVVLCKAGSRMKVLPKSPWNDFMRRFSRNSRCMKPDRVQTLKKLSAVFNGLPPSQREKDGGYN